MRVVLLYCQHCVADSRDVMSAAAAVDDVEIEPVLLPCSSKAQVSELLKILDNGADAVHVVACPETACRQLVGSRRAEKRIGYARSLLEQIDISGERLGITRRTGLSADELIDAARTRARALASCRGEGE